MNVCIILLIPSILLNFLLYLAYKDRRDAFRKLDEDYDQEVLTLENQIKDLREENLRLTTDKAYAEKYELKLERGNEALAQVRVFPQMYKQMENMLEPLAENMALRPENERLKIENEQLRATVQRHQEAYKALSQQFTRAEELRANGQRNYLELQGELNLLKAAKSREEAAQRLFPSRENPAEGRVKVAKFVAEKGAATFDAAFEDQNTQEFKGANENWDSYVLQGNDKFELHKIFDPNTKEFTGEVEVIHVRGRENNMVHKFHVDSLQPGVRQQTNYMKLAILLCGMHKHGGCSTIVLSTQPNQKCCCKEHKDQLLQLEKIPKQLQKIS